MSQKQCILETKLPQDANRKPQTSYRQPSLLFIHVSSEAILSGTTQYITFQVISETDGQTAGRNDPCAISAAVAA